MKKYIFFIICIGMVGICFTTQPAKNEKQPEQKPVTETTCTKVQMTFSNMAEIASSLSIYLNQNDKYPDAANIKKLKESLEKNQFIERMKTTDEWGTQFKYIVTKDKMSYSLISAGCDKQFDTEIMKEGPVPDCKGDLIMRHGRVARYMKECGNNIDHMREALGLVHK